VLVYARTHTQTTWVLDVSPGVGQTPGEPEESRSTKTQYTCRPYRCTQYICLYICCVAGFDDLGQLLFSFNMSFRFRKVEDVTTISKSQSLTSVSIKDCTLRVPIKLGICHPRKKEKKVPWNRPRTVSWIPGIRNTRYARQPAQAKCTVLVIQHHCGLTSLTKDHLKGKGLFFPEKKIPRFC